MLIAGGRSSVAWATTKALVRRRDIVLGTHRVSGWKIGRSWSIGRARWSPAGTGGSARTSVLGTHTMRTT
jgi:hypothetical protein